MARHRYKIEAKNAELKQRHGFDVARASGLFSMELQAATTIFVVNMNATNYDLNKYKITEELAQIDERFLGFHFIKSKRPIFSVG